MYFYILHSELLQILHTCDPTPHLLSVSLNTQLRVYPFEQRFEHMLFVVF